jgi:general secretion pathway protein A
MYAPFYGLRQAPFSIAPDPRFLFMSEAHREALAHLLYGVSGGGGFVLLTGEIGAGKTTVGRCFLDQIPAHCDVAYVFNPKLTVIELLQTVCAEFGIDGVAGARSVKDYVDPLNARLLRAHAAGRSSVLIIDEAQSLSAEVLEQLRLLTNLETAERKLLQIILIGQPELRELLARPELEQLAQRVIARYHLPALTEAQTAQYLRHRLAVAGLQGELPFDAAALRRIHALCGGVPRRINLLADRALLGGYAGGRRRVDRRIVERAAREVFGTPAPKHGRAWALAALVVLTATAALGLAWWAARDRTTVAAPARAASAPAGAASRAALTASQAAPAAARPAPADAAALLADAGADDAAAWRALAQRFGVTLGAGEPCAQALRERLVCYRGEGGLALVRQLDRPGLLTVYDAQNRPAQLLLTGLSDDTATLLVGGREQRVTLASLAGLWRGGFSTFWRAPPGWDATSRVAPGSALAGWLAERLPAGPADASLDERLHAFQVAHGLKPDGLAGPLTLMQVNRASGVAEPRLNSEP